MLPCQLPSLFDLAMPPFLTALEPPIWPAGQAVAQNDSDDHPVLLKTSLCPCRQYILQLEGLACNSNCRFRRDFHSRPMSASVGATASTCGRQSRIVHEVMADEEVRGDNDSRYMVKELTRRHEYVSVKGRHAIVICAELQSMHTRAYNRKNTENSTMLHCVQHGSRLQMCSFGDVLHLWKSVPCPPRRNTCTCSQCSRQLHPPHAPQSRLRTLRCCCCPASSAWAPSAGWGGAGADSAPCPMCERCDTHAAPRLQSGEQSPRLQKPSRTVNWSKIVQQPRDRKFAATFHFDNTAETGLNLGLSHQKTRPPQRPLSGP